MKSPKRRGVYILLAMFLGFLGVHNFYAGYLGRGLFQLLTVLVLAWSMAGFLIVFVWVVAECFMVKRDAAGHDMV